MKKVDIKTVKPGEVLVVNKKEDGYGVGTTGKFIRYDDSDDTLLISLTHYENTDEYEEDYCDEGEEVWIGYKSLEKEVNVKKEKISELVGSLATALDKPKDINLDFGNVWG
jgi:hypothetical protein